MENNGNFPILAFRDYIESAFKLKNEHYHSV